MADEILNRDVAYTPGPGDRRVIEERPVVDQGTRGLRRVSWAAIFGGVLTALGMELLFTFFGFFIGFKLTPGGASTWTVAWYLVTSFSALIIGANVAAKISGNPDRGSGILHGIVTWGLTTVATFAIVLTVAWGLIGGTIQMARAAIIAGAQSPAAVTQAVPPPVQNQAAAAANAAATHPAVVAHNVAEKVSSWSLVIWGGVLLGFCSAVYGGILGSRSIRARRVAAPAPAA